MLISKALDNHRQNPRAGSGGGTGRGAARVRRWILPGAPWTHRRGDPAGAAPPLLALEEGGQLALAPGRRDGQRGRASGGGCPSERGLGLHAGWPAAPAAPSPTPGSDAAATSGSRRAPGAFARRAPHSGERAMGPSGDWAPLRPVPSPPLRLPEGEPPSASPRPSPGSLGSLPSVPPSSGPGPGPPWPRPSPAAWSARSGRRGSSTGTGRPPAGGGAAPARTAGSATVTWWTSSPKFASSASRSADCGAKVCAGGPCREARPRPSPISPPVWGLFGLPSRPRSLISPPQPPSSLLPGKSPLRALRAPSAPGSWEPALWQPVATENSTGQEPAGWPIPTAASSSAGGCGLTPRESLCSLWSSCHSGRRVWLRNVGAMDRGWGEEPPLTPLGSAGCFQSTWRCQKFLGLALSGFPGLLETRWALRLWRRVVISARRSAGAGAREVSGSVFALGASWVEIYQKAA